MTFRRICVPALAIALGLIAGVVTLFVLQVWFQKDIFLVKGVFWGFDYNDFYLASRSVLEGESPYKVKRYVTPPLAASVHAPIGLLRFEQARLVMATLVLFTSVRSYGLMMSATGLREKASQLERRLIMICGLIILFLSYPFYFLLDRLNVDSIVLFLLCMGLLYCHQEEKESSTPLAFAAGIFIAIAICIKVYPLLIVLPLIIGRRWRILLATGATLLLLVVSSWAQWVEYFSGRLAVRTDFLAPDENGSLYSTMGFIGRGVQSLVSQGEPVANFQEAFIKFTPWLFLALIGTKAIADSYRVAHSRPAWVPEIAVWYIPFMFTLPRTAYHYELVGMILLVPALCVLWDSGKGRGQRIALGTILLGIVMSQLHAVSLEHMFANINLHAIPGTGLLLVLLASTTYSVLKANESRLHVNRSRVADAL
jgi:hypothetical protein